MDHFLKKAIDNHILKVKSLGVDKIYYLVISYSVVFGLILNDLFCIDMASTSYQKLEKMMRRYNLLGANMSLLHWDGAVMMPADVSSQRSEILTEISDIAYEVITSNELGDLIYGVESDLNENPLCLTHVQKRNLELIKRKKTDYSLFDQSFLSEFLICGNECEHIWREARINNDFQAYKAPQQKVLGYVRQMAKVKAEAYNLGLYDALLNDFCYGKRSVEIDQVFDKLKNALPNIIDNALSKQKTILKAETEKRFFSGDYPIEKQKSLLVELADILQFDWKKGRLDTSHHPFSTNILHDIRITTRYKVNNLNEAIFSTLHELGHGLYNQHLPTDSIYQLVGDSLGMAIHESQSLLMEMQICRTSEFLEVLWKKVRKIFDIDYVNLEEFIALSRRVGRGKIRVDADECSYPLHVIIRYEIEKDMIENGLEVEDLPMVWNKKYHDYLGCKIENDYEGCMQDIHWSDGSFGYFPCYTLGAIYASMIFEKMNEQVVTLHQDIGNGEFSNINNWLIKNIHNVASIYSEDELMQKITQKEGINVDVFIKHLSNRYC